MVVVVQPKALGSAALLDIVSDSDSLKQRRSETTLHATGTPGSIAAATCVNCYVETMPAARFCHLCGTRLSFAEGANDAVPNFSAERRLVTILFCDLVNSVSLAAGRDPEDVADVLRQFHASLSAVMARFGGRFERPMGDGCLCYFGYPVAAEDDCERAVEAALTALEVVSDLPPQLGERLQVRIGISAGVVVVGDLLGAADHGGHDVIGDVANLAARLQQTAAPGCVLVSEPVWQSTRTAFEFEDLGQVRLRGWTDPVRLRRALRRISKVRRWDARQTAGVAPMIGRSTELAALASAWAQTRDGAGRTVLLTGEPGIGKSRLVHELTARLTQPGVTVIRYLCAPMQQDAALNPIMEQLTHEAGLAGDDTGEVRAAKLAATLADCPAADAALIAGLIAPELAVVGTSLRDMSPERQRDRILAALLARLLRVAASSPLILVVEDAHWSDPTTRLLLSRIADAAPARPLLMVIAARPQFRPDWAERPGVLGIQLDPLPPEESERLVRAASGSARLDNDVVAEIVVRSDGVPLFLEEVTRSMLEPGSLDRDVPASIHASLLSRIDRLGRARGVAEVAATIGRIFDLPLLSIVCDEPAPELSEALRRMIEAGLLRPEEPSSRGTYTFRHALIRDATYGTIVRRRRSALHIRIAESLEHRFPLEAAAQPQRLAQHYAAGGLDRQAAAWWLRAGLQSLQRSAMTEALTQLRRALALLEPLPVSPDRQRTLLEVLVVYGKALRVTEGHAAKATRAVFAQATAICEQLGDPPQLLTVLFTGWTQSFFGGQLARADVQASDILDRALLRSDNVWSVMGFYSLGLTRLLRGDVHGSKELLEEVVGRFDPTRRADYAKPAIGDPLVVTRSFLGWGAMMRGAFAEARQQLDAAVIEAYRLNQPFSISLALYTRFYTVFNLEGAEAAAMMLEEFNTASAGIEHFEAYGQIIQGWLLAAAGDYEAGLEWSRRGRSRHAVGGSQVNHTNILRMEAEMLLGLGRPEQAMDGLNAARRVQLATAEHWDDAEQHRARAEVLMAMSDDAAAAAELAAAEHVAGCRGQHLFALRAATVRARLFARAGRDAEAAASLRRALAAVETGPGVLDVAAAEQWLSQDTRRR